MSVDHYENFPVASILMPRRLRKPVAAIYHFARAADDIADEGDLPDEERLRQLDEFRAELARIANNETPLTPLFQNLAAEIHQHALPMQPFYDLLDAFSQDVVKKRYANFDELLDYCRRSANPVGNLLLHLYERSHTGQHRLLGCDLHQPAADQLLAGCREGLRDRTHLPAAG